MSYPILLEVCIDSVESAWATEVGGAERVELCGDLLEGGITPSAGMIAQVRRRVSIGLQVMIRPRGGDFCYTADEFEVMKQDILMAKQLGADGVVLGILDADGNVDKARTRQLVDLAQPLNVTFHRAFDMSSNLARALQDVIDAGAQRILTSGGEPTAEAGAHAIANLVQSAYGRIIIMAGGGIRADNAANIVAETHVREIHAGLSVPVPGPMRHRNEKIAMGSADNREYQRFAVSEETVRFFKAALAGS
jgi:copper homeostasis protein